jgi:flavin reductase (DIM6/NTAB) family NADH-FMN oxidoreductase RutF
MECRELQTMEFGNNRVIMGQVVMMHVNDELLDPSKRRVKPGALLAVGRMASPSAYCNTRDQFYLDRVAYEEFKNR